MATSHAQVMSALDHANEIRVARAALRRQIAAGTVGAAQVLLDVPEYAWRMTVAQLLTAQRRWGAQRAQKFCAGLGLPETKTLGSFTARQRWLLAMSMPDGAVVADALLAEVGIEAQELGNLCQMLNGSGPCLRPASHDGLCVVAVHRLAVAYFREFSTRRLIAEVSTRGTHGERVPSTLELAKLLAKVAPEHPEPKGPT